MKTAEEIIPDSMPCCEVWRKMFSEIQDEAIAHGMTMSETIVQLETNPYEDSDKNSGFAQARNRMAKSILTARDNKVWRKE